MKFKTIRTLFGVATSVSGLAERKNTRPRAMKHVMQPKRQWPPARKFLAVCIFLSCIWFHARADALYTRFRNPDAQARPFLYWFWNGNCVTTQEVVREIGVMKAGGFGGFAIFPIGTVTERIPGYDPLLWGSPEWCEVVKAACLEAQRLGMKADLVMSCGWPFGGRFLEPEHYIQRIVTQSMPIIGERTLVKTVDELLEQNKRERQKKNSDVTTETLHFIRLIPEGAEDLSQIVDLGSRIKPDGSFEIPLRKGKNYRLVWGVRQRGFRTIVNGTPDIKGPALDHFNRQAVLNYLKRIDEIERRIGIPLRELFRALRCDSIELENANWSDDFARAFTQAYGYDPSPWYPFLFYGLDASFPTDDLVSERLLKRIEQARFDFHRFVVDRFHSAFTQTVRDYCTSKGVAFCYQAYGHPSLIGMPEGYLIPEIPEGNTWLFSYPVPGHEKPVYTEESYWWNRDHGYMIWNKYAAAGGHLTSRRIISCETATNTRQNYDASLEDIKQSCDMTMITGINHFVGHIYNFSPPEAPFPGWVRYTTYFSERNTWWKHVGLWSDYSARLSSVLQDSRAVTDIGIISAEYDVWTRHGFSRAAFQKNPTYLFHLWESLANIGSTCDYLSQGVLDKAFDAACDPLLHFPYKALVLGEVRSITERTADILEAFVQRGGKLVFVGTVPERLLAHGTDKAERKSTRMKKLLRNYPEQVVLRPSPGNLPSIAWTQALLRAVGETPPLRISNPVEYAGQIQCTRGKERIYFFSNSNRRKNVTLKVRFPESELYPWIWDPHTGDRQPLRTANGIAEITMEPVGSKLVVFDDTPYPAERQEEEPYLSPTPMIVGRSWEVTFHPVIGEPFHRMLPQLIEFTTDSQLQTFSGDAVYRCTFTADREYGRLDLGDVNRGVTRVILNGIDLGTKWYGRHEYDLRGALRKGENRLEVCYTSLVKNYMLTIPKHQRPYSIDPKGAPSESGLAGPVTLR